MDDRKQPNPVALGQAPTLAEARHFLEGLKKHPSYFSAYKLRIIAKRISAVLNEQSETIDALRAQHSKPPKINR